MPAGPPPARVEDLLAATLARPLFSPTRRPPDTAQENAGTGSALADKRLSGIVLEPDHRFAIFAVAGGKPLTLTEGESVDGWRIEAITPTEIALAGPNGIRMLQPTLDPNPPVPQRASADGRSPSQPPPHSAQAVAAPPHRAGAPPGPHTPSAVRGTRAASLPPNHPPPARNPRGRPAAPLTPGQAR